MLAGPGGRTVREELFIEYLSRLIRVYRVLPLVCLIPAILSSAAWPALRAAEWWVFTGVCTVLTASRLHIILSRYRNGAGTPALDLKSALWPAIPGLCAAVLIALIFPTGSQPLDFALLITAAALLTAMVGIGPPTGLCFAAAIGPTLLALAAGIVKSGDHAALMVIALLIVYVFACFVLARSIRDDRREQIENSHRLAAALAEARASNTAKSQFLASMSHELRTPLNAILGFSEVIATQTLGPVGSVKYLEYAKDIHFSGNHLLNLINDVLDLAKIEAGKIEVQPKDLDPVSLIEATCRMTAPRAKTNGVRLRQVIAAEPLTLFADERAATQALLNVVTNAIKFNRPGGEVVIELSGPATGGILFNIRDNGPGIPANQIERLFEPFEQGENSYNKGKNGTGLGLAIVRSLMKVHGGSVWIESTVGIGTSVFLHFPKAGEPRTTRTLERAPASSAAR